MKTHQERHKLANLGYSQALSGKFTKSASLMSGEAFALRLNDLLAKTDGELKKCDGSVINSKRKAPLIPRAKVEEWMSKINERCSEEIVDIDEVVKRTAPDYSMIDVAALLNDIRVRSTPIAFIRVHLRVIRALQEWIVDMDEAEQIQNAKYVFLGKVKDAEVLDAMIYADLAIKGDYADRNPHNEKFPYEFKGCTVGKYDWLVNKYRDALVCYESPEEDPTDQEAIQRFTDEEISAAIERLVAEGLITRVRNSRDTFLYAEENYSAEQWLLNLPQTLTPKKRWVAVEGDITECEFEFSADQKSAVRTLIGAETVSVLSGPGGSGKTTLIGQVQKQTDCAWLYLATTGKAAQALQASTGQPASTISRLAIIIQRCPTASPTYKTEVEPYMRTPTVIVVDEVSMLSIIFLKQLRTIVEHICTAKVILTGDRFQLPPVGIGGLFHSLCYLGERGALQKHSIAYAELTTTHRFAKAKNQMALLKTVGRLRTQCVPTFDCHGALCFDYGQGLEPARRKFEAIPFQTIDDEVAKYRTSDKGAMYTLAKLAEKAAEGDLVLAYRNIDCSTISAFHAAMIRGDKEIIEELKITQSKTKQGAARIRTICKHYIQDPRVGDKVSATVNLKGHKRVQAKVTDDFFNGELGEVTELAEFQIQVTLEGRPIWMPYVVYHTFFVLAAAITIHKSQGSQADYVWLYLHNAFTTSTDLLYVGLTRGKILTSVVYPADNKVHHKMAVAPLTSAMLPEAPHDDFSNI